MATPIWKPGYVYAPGAVVQPTSTPTAIPSPPTNGAFESGDTGWTLGTGFNIQQNVHPFTGTWSLRYNYSAADNYATNTNSVPVTPGQKITASCQVRGESAHSTRSRGRIVIAWYDASDVLIAYSTGNWVGFEDTYGTSALTEAVAPAGAVSAKVGAQGHVQSGYAVTFDVFIWDALEAPTITGLVFKAVQAASGHSGTNEPDWPIVVGQQVVDNEVTWEAEYITRVTWEASPILVSGGYEPTWPLLPGGTVRDGTLVWEAISGRVTDAKCPQSAAVAIAASKIFAADGDIIAFCATVNPLDWSTEQDAGYIPFGLNTYGSTPCSALGLYRGNLVAFNSEGYQMWQVDEDPANMAILDASPIDCPYPRSIQPVSNDLVFLSAQGVRSIGIAGASTNLQAGFFGKQIDPLVLAAIAAGDIPFALFWPGMGQYWLIFGATAFVLTMNGGSKDASWSRYVFPAVIEGWALLDEDLYLLAEGGLVWRMSEDATQDDARVCDAGTVSGTAGYDEGLPTLHGFDTQGGSNPGELTIPTVSASIALLAPNQVAITTLGVGDFEVLFADVLGAPAVDSWYSVTVAEWGETFYAADATYTTLGGGVATWGFASAQHEFLVGTTYTLTFELNCAGTDTDFSGYIAWNYLDFGALGVDKQMEGFTLVCTGAVNVQFGYSQRDTSLVTDSYDLDGDTLPGTLVPMPLTAPSFQLRLTFDADQVWEWNAAAIRLTDQP